MLGGGERRPPSLGRSLLAEPLLHARACSCRAPWQQCTQPTAMRCRRDARAAPLGLRRAHRHLHRRHLRHMRRLVQRVCARHAWHWHGAAGAHCGAAGAMQQANGRGVRQAHRSRRAVRAAPAPSTLLVAARRPQAGWLGHHLPAGQERALTWQVAAWISSEWAARASGRWRGVRADGQAAPSGRGVVRTAPRPRLAPGRPARPAQRGARKKRPLRARDRARPGLPNLAIPRPSDGPRVRLGTGWAHGRTHAARRRLPLRVAAPQKSD